MRLNLILRRQHLDRMFKKHWVVQGQRVPQETGAAEVLQAKQIPVYDPKEILKEPQQPFKVDVIGYKPKPIPNDETHPNWHTRPCHICNDKNALVEGMDQAQVLLKTVHLEGLPESYQQQPPVNDEIISLSKQALISSQLFDAEQLKLPIRKDPKRPAWNFPRDFGITHSRRMRLFTAKIGNLLGNSGNVIINNAIFASTFEKDGELVQLKMRGDSLVVSRKSALGLVYKGDTEDLNLPSIFPLKPTISIPRKNIYEIQNYYALKNNLLPPKTIIIHHNTEEVKNLHETEVTESQTMARGFLKTFVTAASYAKERYGVETKDLKDPVVVHSVNTNGKFFQFGILQLNTLDLNGVEGKKNIYYSTEPLNLFENCGYKDGRPVLEGFNPQVINYLNTFYNK